MSFFEELKRRNVFRVGVAYVIAAWVFLQVADLVLDAIEAPGWVLQALMLVVGLGFVAAVIIAWAYELTPEGIKREKDVVREQSITGHTGRKLDRIIIAFLVVAVLVLLYRQTAMDGAPEPKQAAAPATEQGEPTTTPTSPAKSIAVLPFRDMSPGGDQAYFAEGISEELLNALVKLGGLKVASRTSAFALVNEGLDIPAIAQRLDVATVLEGSVRTAGQQVRVTAQLIDVAEDAHLWSETYNGTLDNIFDIQDEITGKITAALEIQLAGSKPEAFESALTSNGEAYQLYLQGRHFWRQRSAPALYRAIELFKRAVELDPEFHQAWSNLGIAYSNLPDYDQEADFWQSLTLSDEAADRALALAPKSSEALLLKANFHSFTCDAVGAARQYKAAITTNPNDPTAHHWYGIALLGAGRTSEGLAEIREARRLDPLISAVAGMEAAALFNLGQFDQAVEGARQAAALGLYGGSPLFEGLLRLTGGEKEEGIRLIRESAEYPHTPGGELLEAYLQAAQDPSRSSEFERLITYADPERPYEALTYSDMLAYLGSSYLFEYFSKSECPVYETSVWAPTFREQRGSKEFFDLMERAGVVEFWHEYGWPDDCASLDQELAECP